MTTIDSSASMTMVVDCSSCQGLLDDRTLQTYQCRHVLCDACADTTQCPLCSSRWEESPQCTFCDVCASFVENDVIAVHSTHVSHQDAPFSAFIASTTMTVDDVGNDFMGSTLPAAVTSAQFTIEVNSRRDVTLVLDGCPLICAKEHHELDRRVSHTFERDGVVVARLATADFGSQYSLYMAGKGGALMAEIRLGVLFESAKPQIQLAVPSDDWIEVSYASNDKFDFVDVKEFHNRPLESGELEHRVLPAADANDEASPMITASASASVSSKMGFELVKFGDVDGSSIIKFAPYRVRREGFVEEYVMTVSHPLCILQAFAVCVTFLSFPSQIIAE